MFRTMRNKLTKDQVSRNVVYSSALIREGFDETEQDTIHEVMEDDPKRDEIIHNLKDVTFFKNFAAECGWNVINIVRQ